MHITQQVAITQVFKITSALKHKKHVQIIVFLTTMEISS